MNPKITQLIQTIKDFAAAQPANPDNSPYSNDQAFKVAVARLVRMWAADQGIPEDTAQGHAMDHLAKKQLVIKVARVQARESVADTHQAEVDAIVAGIPITD